jgi:hypothetical protein
MKGLFDSMSDSEMVKEIDHMYWKFENVLYHGTISEISKVDTTKGMDKKDFRKGFYMEV